MSSNFKFIKNSLMGSTTMPYGTGGGLTGLLGGHGHHGHVHKEDGSCCGHDHGSGDHHHHHHHDHTHDCGHDHGPGESCGGTGKGD